MDNGLKKYAVFGIAGVLVYFLSVTLFLVTKSDIALTFWEIMTVAGALVELLVVLKISEAADMKGRLHTLMIIFLSGTLIVTSIAHFSSIGVVRPLEAQGTSVPDYFKIGKFPSLEMTLDYTAWGLFMGSALLCLFFGLKRKALKTVTLISSLLCFAGFVGSFFMESLWYPAPMGYGMGFMILCIMLCRNGNTSKADA